MGVMAIWAKTTWNKRTQKRTVAFGTGWYTRGNTEMLVIGARGEEGYRRAEEILEKRAAEDVEAVAE